MRKTMAILGRQPAIAIAELESLFGADLIRPIGQAAIVDIDPKKFPQKRLGGTIKAGEILAYIPSTDWKRISRYLINHVPKMSRELEDGKMILGISTFDIITNPKLINETSLTIKYAVRDTGRSIRVVPTNGMELNSAQVLHNRLADSPLGMELLLVRDGDRTILAQTYHVQDIEAYAARDQARPKRDARVGMLPPKLAQIILNIATGDPRIIEEKTFHPPIILDPFCGTGVMLQEALLMGYQVIGSDIDQRMIDYAKANMEWLRQRYDEGFLRTLEVHDATEYKWFEMSAVDAIASETYLGRPFSAQPVPEVLSVVTRDVNTILRKFLRNVASQTKPGFRMCIAVPAWRMRSGFKHLETLDKLSELGYTRVSFVHVKDEDLIYYRANQFVGRELVVLTRK